MKKCNIMIYILGLLAIQVGVSIFIRTNIGSDPFTVFLQGIGRTFDISIGFASVITMISLLIIIFFINQNALQLGTIVAVITAGPLLDIVLRVIPDFQNETLLLNAFFVIASCFIISIGVSILLVAEIGVGPYDLLSLTLQGIVPFQYRWIRIGVDIMFLISGYLLGGTVGFGTIIGALLIGPFIQFFLPIIERFIHKYIVFQKKR